MAYEKSIQFDRETRDYRMELNGEFVGFARNYHEAEIELDRLVFDALIYSVTYDPPKPPPDPDPLPDPGPGGPGVPGDDRPDLDLLDDIHNVLDMCLGYTSDAAIERRNKKPGA